MNDESCSTTPRKVRGSWEAWEGAEVEAGACRHFSISGGQSASEEVMRDGGYKGGRDQVPEGQRVMLERLHCPRWGGRQTAVVIPS